MENKKMVPEIRFSGFTDPWEQHKLGDIGTITTGSTPSTSIPDYYSDDGIIWVTPTDIIENITFESARKLSELGQQVGRVVPKNTILITCIASIGKNTMLVNTGSFNQQINGLTPNENKYEPYFLLTESELWSAQMKKSAAAGTMQIINRTEFSGLETWIPTLNEQKVIGTYFRSLDNLITLHQRKLEKLKTFKKAMLDKMFPKNGELVPEIRFSGFTDPWEQRKLDDITDVRDGTHDSPQYLEVGHPFVTSKNVKDGFINYEDIQYISDQDFEEINKRSKVDKNDILMGMIGTIGNIALVREVPDFAIKNIALIKDIGDIFYHYLYHCLQSNSVVHQLDENLDGGTQKFIALNKIRELVIPVPSEYEQHKIGECMGLLDNIITLHQRKLEKLQNIKKSMLNKMFI